MSTQHETLSDILYIHREGALTCFDHTPTADRRVWCCVCGEHDLIESWRDHVATHILRAGFVIPQVKLPTFVAGADYSPDSPHYGKPHEDCCK